MVVDFPAPLGPMKPKISPLSISRLTSSIALILLLRYVLVRFLTISIIISSLFIIDKKNQDVKRMIKQIYTLTFVT